jgi:hypothetical protein
VKKKKNGDDDDKLHSSCRDECKALKTAKNGQN